MRNELKYMFFLVVALILGACSKNNDVYDNENTHKITFTIAMTDPETVSRATWGEDYEKENGVSFDYYIKPESLKVRILTEENSVVDEVENLTYWKEDENSYRFMGEISSLSITDGDSYKVEVIANCPVPTDDNWDIKYSRVDDLNEAIPMWGIQTAKFTLGTRTDIGTIDLLRAAAKVEVKLSDELIAAGYRFPNTGAAMLKGYTDSGWCLPVGSTIVSETKEISYFDNDKNSYIIKTNGINKNTTQPLDLSIQDGGVVTYVPECDNLVSSPSTITVNILKPGETSATTYTDALRFCSYDKDGFAIEGSEYPMVRNHIYRFTITKIQEGVLSFIYVVDDWDDKNWNYSMEEPINTVVYPERYIDDPDNFTFTDNDIPTMYYDANNVESGAFSCWFNMSKPDGETWTPTINRPNTEYQILVYKRESVIAENDILVYDSYAETGRDNLVVDPDVWYNIKVVPLKPVNTAVKVKFGISCSQSWMLGSSTFLYINGTSIDDIKWVNSGNDPMIVEITQNR